MAKKTKKKVRKPVRKTVKRAVKRTAPKRPASKKKLRVVKRPATKAKPAKKSKGSFGVLFVRSREISEIRGPNGWTRKPGKTRKSERRFATRKEALHHGKRFKKIEGHKSFSVFLSKDKVNAKINWKTGKTNPIIGLGRTNR